MTNLTEQWKKGKLPNGWYYVRLIRGEYRIDLYINGKNEWIDCPDDIIDTIVCEVPDYVEWRNMVNCACEEHEENNRLIEENAQLKSLLGECVDWLTYIDRDNGIIAKINQVLGEE